MTGTAVTSSPDANSSYVTGDVIQVTATFNEAVTVDTAERHAEPGADRRLEHPLRHLLGER